MHTKETYIQIEMIKEHVLMFTILIRSLEDNLLFDRTEHKDGDILECFIATSYYEEAVRTLKLFKNNGLIKNAWVADIKNSSVYGNYKKNEIYCIF